MCVPIMATASLFFAEILQFFFSKIDFLDVSMPLLIDSSLQTSISIAQLLANAVRSKTHKAAVTEWLPPADRLKEVKGKRGWEVPSTTKLNSPSRLGGWVVRNLTASLRFRDSKVLVSCVIIYLFWPLKRLRSCKKLLCLHWQLWHIKIQRLLPFSPRRCPTARVSISVACKQNTDSSHQSPQRYLLCFRCPSRAQLTFSWRHVYGMIVANGLIHP
jgi:hypothetical protein